MVISSLNTKLVEDRLGFINKAAAKLKKLSGNRLVHFYHEVTDKELYLIIKNNLSDIVDFVKNIKAFLE